MRSKQLGALLNTVPPATARSAARPAPVVPVHTPTRPPAVAAPAAPRIGSSSRDVPLQVLIPEHVREQLGILAARERTSLRALILRAVRGGLGVEVTEEEIKDKRGRRP